MSMNRNQKSIILLLFLILFIPACSKNPWIIWENSTITYTTTLKTLSDLRRAGKIDNITYKQIEEVRIIAAKSLDDMEEAARNEEQISFATSTRIFDNALNSLIEWRVRVEKGDN